MITTKITIEQHIAEYCIGKWGDDFAEPVRFPDTSDIYFTIYDLTQKRPLHVHHDDGNLEIVLPNRSKDGQSIRKNPDVYNYISERSSKIIAKKICSQFWAELHEFIDDQKHRYGIEYVESVYTFMLKYRITGITEDALLKNYQRWRQLLRQRKTRGYCRKKIDN